MLDSCVTEEERNIKLAMAVVRVTSKDIARAVLTNKDKSNERIQNYRNW